MYELAIERQYIPLKDIKKSMKGLLIAAIGVMALVGMMFAPIASATTYYGPSFTVTGTNPGGPVYITVTSGSSNTFVSPPEGSGAKCTGGTTCVFPLQACTDSTSFYYSIHEVTITDPSGTQYMLGSSVTSGLYWPNVLGGPVAGPNTLPLSDGKGNQGDALNVTIGDSFVLPFGQGAGGFTFSTTLLSPPQTHTPEGPYYWFTTSYGANPPGLRLDTTGSAINPTTVSGTYVADVEGVVVCGSGVFFDQGVQVFFDSPSNFTVPQFPAAASMVGVVAVGMVALAIMKSRQSSVKA